MFISKYKNKKSDKDNHLEYTRPEITSSGILESPKL